MTSRLETTPQRRAVWPTALLWGLLAAILLVGGHIILGACGIVVPGLGRPLVEFCPAPPAVAATGPAELDRERLRERALQERLDRLQLTLAAAPACPVPPPAADPPPVAEVTPPEVPPAEAAPSEGLPAEVALIPEQEWEDRDVTLLEGCWTLISGIEITDVATDQLYGVRDWQICFDEAGNGRQTIVFEDGTTCDGAMTAQFLDNGNLRFEDDADIICTGGFRIFRIINECERLDDGTARCSGRQPDQGTEDIVSQFRR